MRNRDRAKKLIKAFFLGAWALAACQPAPLSFTPTVQPAPATPSPVMPTISAPTATLPAPTATAAPSPEPSLEICSPLDGIEISDLPQIISNPFDAPPLGQDDGHHGVDLAFYRFGDRVSMEGLQIHAVLLGKVVGVIANRPPYGYAVVIETAPETITSLLPILTQAAPAVGAVQPHPALNCPEPQQQTYDPARESLYLLYAHMAQPPLVAPGDEIVCGQTLGEVGTTGMSVNLHLHLEARLGPSGYRFASMAHYENAASQDEMANYCLWRVTNTFRMFDPMLLFALQTADAP